MYEKSFIKRIRNLGVNKVFLSYDFIIQTGLLTIVSVKIFYPFFFKSLQQFSL